LKGHRARQARIARFPAKPHPLHDLGTIRHPLLPPMSIGPALDLYYGANPAICTVYQSTLRAGVVAETLPNMQRKNPGARAAPGSKVANRPNHAIDRAGSAQKVNPRYFQNIISHPGKATGRKTGASGVVLHAGTLPRCDFGNLEFQQAPALRTDQRFAVRHVDFRGIAPGAGHGGVGSLGQRVGRHNPGGRSARDCSGRFESGPALRAHVVEAAVGRATVEYFARAAHRARQSQFASLHATSCPGSCPRASREPCPRAWPAAGKTPDPEPRGWPFAVLRSFW